MKNKNRLVVLMLLILTHSGFAQQNEEPTLDEFYNFFSEIPILEEAFIDASPEDRKDGIKVGKLGIDGGDKETIFKLVQELTSSTDTIIDSFLIHHKGKLLFESYNRRGRIDVIHPQASATKSFTSLTLGRAIQMGYISMSDLDKPLTSFLKELDPTKFADGAEKITLHQALTSTTGIRISDVQREKMEQNPSLYRGQLQVQAMLEHSTPITEASQVFKYGDGVDIVMQVIEAVVPGTAKDFIKNEFFNKMGITDYFWLTDEVNGLPASGWRMSVTSRDMIKIGSLAINKGKWNGKQLIPEAYIAKATSRIVTNSDDENFSDIGDVINTGYGYFLWQADLKVGNENYYSTSARGGGGQYIIVIEELDLIIVSTGHNNNGNDTLQIIADNIIPAFIK